MPTLHLSDKQQWASSPVTRALKEALLQHREELKEAWAMGSLDNDRAEQRAIGAIQNIDSTLNAIGDLSKEDEIYDAEDDALQSGGA